MPFLAALTQADQNRQCVLFSVAYPPVPNRRQCTQELSHHPMRLGTEGWAAIPSSHAVTVTMPHASSTQRASLPYLGAMCQQVREVSSGGKWNTGKGYFPLPPLHVQVFFLWHFLAMDPNLNLFRGLPATWKQLSHLVFLTRTWR